MKQTVNIYDFRDAFLNGYGGTYRNNFSWEGLELLFDYLEDLEQDMGEEIELDVVAICCDFSEESAEDIAANYECLDIDVKDLDEQFNLIQRYQALNEEIWDKVREQEND